MLSLSQSLRRYSLAFAFAATTTGALLLLMEQLIRSDEMAIEVPKPPIPLEFVPRIEEPPPEPTREPPVPPQVERPPVVALVPTADVDTKGWGDEFTPPHDPSGEVNIGLNRADGGLLSLAQVTPNYPERARRAGIEGYVVVEFTVDATGAVQDAVVVEAQPQGTFNRAAVNAVLRSKYRPRIEGGNAKVVRGVRKRVLFNLQT